MVSHRASDSRTGPTPEEPKLPADRSTENSRWPDRAWPLDDAWPAEDQWPFRPADDLWPFTPSEQLEPTWAAENQVEARLEEAQARDKGRRTVRTPVAFTPVGEPMPRVRKVASRRRVLTTSTFLLLLVAMLAFAKFGNTPGQHPDRAAIKGAGSPGTHAGRATAAGVEAGGGAIAGAGTSGRFAYVQGSGPVLGVTGPIHRFHIAVESPAGPHVGADFTNAIDQTLGDRRSWIASRQFRLQRVAPSAAAEFTVYLASEPTSKRMCEAGGLKTDGYTSCHVPGKVIINDARWEHAVPGYRAPLTVYRAYAINHEVGHQLGHGHEACPGKGRPAPVMMQQTYGLKGCVPNEWPYLNGKRYAGPPAP